MTTPTSPTERVGRYQLLEPIGIGPSGTVSRAKVFGVAGFERQFAVKRFHAELTATAAMAAGLSAAARAYGSLEHPRIARMSEFGVAQGATFTAVEYVPGLDALRLTAEARLTGNALAAGGALALVSQAARAVGYAHGRGLTHLGLAPTNVIVTADGDIKITDFGILSATLPQRPIDVPRLAQRIPYLAPEQLANEATSAATDVFALGVLAYELVTGVRTFRGDTPQQVASSIMAGPPAEPPLPRPIVRVLQRCLARSPFERFPDARALADALDAALRVAPVPGTRKDIGAQVKDTLDRLAALNDGQMSGMVALHLGTGPIRRVDDDRAAPNESSPPMSMSMPYELGPAGPVDPTSGLGGVTLSDLPRMPMTTVPGLPPPPIPVPPGLGPPSIPPPPTPGSGTLLGMGNKPPPPAIPSKSRPGSIAGIPPLPPAAMRSSTRSGIDVSLPLEPPPSTLVQAPAASTESAVHTLDPSDLLSIDALPEEIEAAAAAQAAAASEGDHAAGDAGDDAADAATEPADASAASAAAETPDSVEPTGSATASDAGVAATASATASAAGPPPASAAADASSDDPERTADDARAMPVASSADDFQDAPTHALSRSAAAAAASRSAASRASRYPLDPNSIDTKPIPPVTLEQLSREGQDDRRERAGLFDPIARPDRDTGPPDRRSSSTLDEDQWFDDPAVSRAPTVPTNPDHAPGSGRVARPTPSGLPGSGKVSSPLSVPGSSRMAVPSGLGPAPGSGRASTSSDAAPEPKVGQTMLGYAAPPLPARATPAAPFAPVTTLPPEDRADDELPVPALPPEHKPEPQADPLSEMVLEGFRTGPAATEEQGWPQEPSAGPGDEPPPEQLATIPAMAEDSAIQHAPQGWMPAPMAPAPMAPMPGLAEGSPRRRALWISVGMVGAVAVALGAWQLYERLIAPPSGRDAMAASSKPPSDGPHVQAPLPPPAPTATPIEGSGSGPGSSVVAAAKPPGPGSGSGSSVVAAAKPPGPGSGSGSAAVAPPGPPSTPPPPGPPPGPGDNLMIASTPPGARVFLDGADAGVTPLKLPGSPDRHTIAILLAGHELYVAQVDGHGSFQIPLKEVTPTNGPAGIKVLRCKDKERYYVFVDGKPTGQTCPSERIGCELGPHTVEVYDVVSETRRKWDIVVKETRLSFRVRVE